MPPQPQNEPNVEEEQNQGWTFRSLLSTMMRVYFGYIIVNTVLVGFFGQKGTQKPYGEYNNNDDDSSNPISTTSSQISTQTQIPDDYNPITAFFQSQTSFTGEASHIQPTYEIPSSIPYSLRNLWREGSRLQFECWFTSEEEIEYDMLLELQSITPSLTTLAIQKTIYYDWDDNVSYFGNEPYTETNHIDLLSLSTLYYDHLHQHNQTLYAHIYIYQQGSSPSITHPRYNAMNVLHLSDKINRFVYVPHNKKLKSLLQQNNDDSTSSTSSSSPSKSSTSLTTQESTSLTTTTTQTTTDSLGETVNYIIPTLTVRLIVDSTIYPPGGIPQPLSQFFNIFPRMKGYQPAAYIDRFWEMRSDFVQVYPSNDKKQHNNDNNNNHDENIDLDQNSIDTTQLTTINTNNNNKPPKTLNFTISYAPQTLIRWTLQRQIDITWVQQEQMGLTSRTQNDTTKRLILETNPWLLGITICVSMLHTIFEFLAFKNDVTHWKSIENGRGLSIRTLFYNAFSQAVIFLYLLDNDTSYIILASTAFSVVLEIWKITKARDITFKSTYPFIQFDTKTTFDDAGETDEHDAVAFQYLTYIMIPLALGYTIYSLIYNQFTSWYSFIISTMVSFIYTFGFIPMTAQLFINYQLKSTAHIPAKVWMYKCLNTFIDDLFSFVIKMPWLHRLACLRDDLVFLVLLYQKWIYRVDYTRANEYGQVFDEHGQQVSETITDDGTTATTTTSTTKTTKTKTSKVTKVTKDDSSDDSDSDNDFTSESDSDDQDSDKSKTIKTKSKTTKSTSNAINIEQDNNQIAKRGNKQLSNDSIHQLPTHINNTNNKFKPDISSTLAQSINSNENSTRSTPPPNSIQQQLQLQQQQSQSQFNDKALSGKGKYGDDGMFPDEEIPKWVLDNQKKLLEMKRIEDEKLKNDPTYSSIRAQQHALAELEIKQHYGLIDKDGNEIEPKMPALPPTIQNQMNNNNIGPQFKPTTTSTEQKSSSVDNMD